MKLTVPEYVISLCRTLRDLGYEAHVVGGSVRDQLLGIRPNDYDIATNCLPKNVMHIFRDNGFVVIPVGLKHGTVSVLVDGIPHEITTYRKEAGYLDGRRPHKVFFLDSLRADLGRRDFTINAFAYDPIADTFIDYFSGVDDMRLGLIRAVGDPKKRFSEDHLRMLRAIRYAARFGYAIETETLEAIKTHAAKIVKIAPERILSELTKMAAETGKKFAHALELLKEVGLLRHILPEIDIMSGYKHEIDTHPEGDIWQHTLAAIRQNGRSDSILNLAILFHDAGKPKVYSEEHGRVHYLCHHESGLEVADAAAERLRMSGELREALKFVVHNHMKIAGILQMTNHKFMQLLTDKNWDVLYQASYCDDASRLHLFDKDFWRKVDERINKLREEYIENKKLGAIRKVVNGQFVMNVRKIPPGPELGAYIDKTIEWIINNSVDLNDIAKIETFIRAL